MRKRILAAVTAAAALAVMAASSQAAVITYVYEGKTSGSDLSGIFGPAGDFGPIPFVATFRRDESVTPSDIGGSMFESYIQGYDEENPITASLTIGAVTWNFRPEFGRQAQEDQRGACGPGCDYEAVVHEALANFDGVQERSHVYEDAFIEILGQGLGANVLPTGDFRDLPAIGPGSGFEWRGEFNILKEVIDLDTGWRVSSEHAFGSLYVEKLTVFGAAAVPEPATWALMILGFGGAGAMLRRRRAPALA